MPNPLEKIESVAETVGNDVAHVAEDVFEVGGDVLRVLTSAKHLAPAFKTELATLTADIEPIAAALTPAIAAGGTNVVIDLAAIGPVLADIKKLVTDFSAFLPTIKAAIAQIEADVPRSFA